MTWMVRRFLIPFAVGGLLCIGLLLAWSIWGSHAAATIGLRDFAFAAMFILPFQAVGLAILIPIALLLGDLSLPKPVHATLLAVVGAVLGIVVVLPLSDGSRLVGLALPATCGALSALIWFALNQDAVKRRA